MNNESEYTINSVAAAAVQAANQAAVSAEKAAVAAAVVGVNIDNIKVNIKEIKDTLKEMSTQYVPRHDYEEHLKADEDHENRIRKVEVEQTALSGRILGIITTVGAVFAIISLIAGHYWHQ